MDDIKVLQGRILAALDRIAVQFENLHQSDIPEQESVVCQLELEQERAKNQQYAQSLEALNDQVKHDRALHDTTVKTYRHQIEILDCELHKLRTSHEQMCVTNSQLRTALAEGLATPELIDQAIKAELDALYTQKSIHAAEVKAVLSELKPLIKVE